MKINKIYISAFGGLKDFTLELNDGFNVVFGENENGKTTVMTFVRMMFYGASGKSRQLSKTPRKKYQPWSGDTMGGRIYFEHKDRNYCLEREFRGSDSTDKVVLRDLDLGTSEVVSSNIGTRFFGLSVGAFEKSVFIGQSVFLDSDEASDGELNSKLSNLSSTGDEDTSYQIVYSRIDNAQQKLMTKRRVGIYDKGLEKLEELKKTLEINHQKARRKLELTGIVTENTKKLIKVKNEYQNVKKLVDSENDVKNAAKLQEYLNLKAELDKLNEGIRLKDGNLIDDLFIGKINFCISKYETEKSRIEERSQEIEDIKANIALAENANTTENKNRLENLQNSILSLNEEKQKFAVEESKITSQITDAENYEKAALEKKKPFHPVLLSVGIAVAVAAVVLFALKLFIIALPIALTAVVFIALAFVIRPADKSYHEKALSKLTQLRALLADCKNKNAQLQSRINETASEVTLLTAVLDTDKALLQQKKDELEQKLNALEEIKKSAETQLDSLTALFSRYREGCDYEEIVKHLPLLTQKTDEQKQLKLRLKYLSSDLGGISYEDAEKKLITLSENPVDNANLDFTAEKEKLELLLEQGASLTKIVEAAGTELKTAFRELIEPDTIRKEIVALEEQLDSQKTFYEAAEVAKSVLEESFAEVRRSYGNILEQKTLDIFSSLTNGKYNSVNISKSLDIETSENGSISSYSVDYLSTGTMDQTYLSLRLALSELISQEETLPILLDDVLAQYDDRRTESALSFLKDYSSKTQTVLFTCHNNIVDKSKALGGTVINLIK